ncbi:hypothetical protein OEIGOIKO_00723 [Streptomyces chrestomyceticus JCM 4735]|uniref:Uncharacterized protein n=1 Tax=Streptomyces chrestomyceticus JCM 4735 TaxID=1306181 RepID=A0A7U9PVX8_9ACTN|nr:hypothetical protein [Streptomyces chrestomyceticus]GCD33005.1 hypothetical protein OEIGOIKO_00723 [Streptomyces chrestomyceticus JCM 4735]
MIEDDQNRRRNREREHGRHRGRPDGRGDAHSAGHAQDEYQLAGTSAAQDQRTAFLSVFTRHAP